MKSLLHPALLALALSCSTLGAAAPVHAWHAQPKPPETKIDPALPKGLFLASPPTGAPVLLPPEAKKTVKVGDTITLVGRVGGSKAPFVAGRSVLTIVGDALPACSDNPDDHCKLPWDYCCETKADIAKNSATVQIVDDKGKTLRVDLKGQNGITELSALTVVGKVAQVSDKLLIVSATGIYVNPPLPHGFFLKSKPANAKPVEEVKASAKPGDTVTITGRIGGAAAPFDPARATFTLIGPALARCSDEPLPASTCKTPWDYCRHTSEDIAKHAATIQVTDATAAPLPLTLRGRNALAETSTVSVTGKVLRSDAGTLTIAATGIYIHPKP